MVVLATCDSDLSQVGRKILNGALVVFPTDTVYGLGSSPLSTAGVQRCFAIKKRSPEKKFPVLFSTIDEAEKFVVFDKRARLLARGFWPGKLTLILPISEIDLPSELLDRERTLAVRVPNHDCCLRLISACGNSLIGTSANFSGENPTTDPDDEGLVKFAQTADYFLKGPCGESKLASTIVDASRKGRLDVLREGAVSKEQISAYLENASKTDFSLSVTRS